MTKTRKLIECALLIAISTVLSLIQLIDLPYGGSVTAACMLPMVILSYRHGFSYGLMSGIVCGIIQQLVGLHNLSYVTGFASVIAVMLLDYIAAYAVTFTGCIFKGKLKENIAIPLSAAICGLLRYICHVISGCTVWAGLSVPTASALTFSLIYNATYMIPETIVLVTAAFYISEIFDFDGAELKRVTAKKGNLYSLFAWLLIVAAAVFDTDCFFSVMQDAETGKFTLANITSSTVITAVSVTAVCVTATAVLLIIKKRKSK